MLNKPTLLLLLLIILMACSHRTGGELKEEKLDLHDAVNREASGLKRHHIISEDNKLSFALEARTAPKVTFVDSEIPAHFISFDVGSSAPIECFFYNSELSPATTLKRVTNNIFESKTELGVIQEKQLAAYRPGVIGDIPYLLLDISFVARKNEQNRVGYLKTLIATKGRDSLLCLHNEVGYRDTFFRIFSLMARTFEYQRPGEPPFRPFYSSVLLYKVNNIPLGFSINYFMRGEKGQRVMVNKSSKILPISNSEFIPSDDVVFEISDADGDLVQGRYLEEYDLALRMELMVTRLKKGQWQVEGISPSGEVKHLIKAPQVLTNYGQAKKLARTFFEQGKKKLTIPSYVPELNPRRLTDVHYSTSKVNDEGASVDFVIDKKKSNLTVDPSGAIRSVEIKQGPATITGELIYSQGAFK